MRLILILFILLSTVTALAVDTDTGHEAPAPDPPAVGVASPDAEPDGDVPNDYQRHCEGQQINGTWHRCVDESAP